MSSADTRAVLAGIPPEVGDRIIELMQEFVAEAMREVLSTVVDEESRQLRVQEIAERTGQTAMAVYAQVKRRAENGLEASGALHKLPGRSRGWRVVWGPYRRWLDGGA